MKIFGLQDEPDSKGDDEKPVEHQTFKKPSKRNLRSDGRSSITQIKHQVKNTNRVSVFVDGKYTFSLTLDQLLEQKIKKGDVVEEFDIKRFKSLSDEGKLKARVLDWLLMRPHSTREFRDYMYRKKAEKDLTEAWIEEFTEKKYLDDHKFATWFAENRLRKNKSVRAIRSELFSKGIQAATIQSVVAELETDDKDALKTLIKKLRNRPRYKDQQKLMANLASKGFSYTDIKAALLGIEEEDEV